MAAWRFEESEPMRYTLVLEQDEDGGYVARLPALPGCRSDDNFIEDKPSLT
jgi:hypothetical protein